MVSRLFPIRFCSILVYSVLFSALSFRYVPTSELQVAFTALWLWNLAWAHRVQGLCEAEILCQSSKVPGRKNPQRRVPYYDDEDVK